MTKVFPDVSSTQMIKILERLEFEFVRQTGGSHAIYRRASDNRRTTVPIHEKKSLKRRTIKSICRDIGLQVDKLAKFL